MIRPLLLGLTVCLLAACGADDAPPSAPAPTAAPAAAEATDTVLGVASASADLSTFVGLVEAAGLGETLGDTSQTLTVFAPSNAAFAALGPDALAALRADPDALRTRLEGHVLAYRLFTTDADVEQTVETVAGTEITLVPGTPLVVRGGSGSARVATPDLDAGNGVVHVLDAVLSP